MSIDDNDKITGDEDFVAPETGYATSEVTNTEQQSSVETIAEGKAEVSAVTHFQNKEDVLAYFGEQNSIDSEYKAKLKEQHGILFDDTDHRAQFNFIQIGDKRVYEYYRFIDDALEDKLPKDLKVEKRYEPFGSIDHELIAESSRYVNSVQNIQQLPKETLMALKEYQEWEWSDTGKHLDAAVATGQVSQEKASEIKQAKADGKEIVSNADNFYWHFNLYPERWRKKQLHWIIGEAKKDQK